ncbi:pitrilysin family protein [Rubrivirga sp. S365]|uniref:Pitrilysin family protein n=1 Tax=Rubrivirga litoralis TaxID=3075598 RepID=A0ABU3BMU5_9BACT|nr:MULTISPECIES: pitrilysin family protein [unclassified Rubrivirga]MDT0630604.1 pitrilysin family protein [Rubrivirga sp. F394]MDT7857683.1 pitrilysin family protein [Rubrivirga sp. S365]
MTETAAAPLTDHPEFVFETASGGVEAYRHRRNGMLALLLDEAAAPVVAFQVTYRVGSRNEGAGLTGATHLLEHLMFKGTERFNRDLGTSVFQTLQAVGGQINATTWYDRTNYYALLPSEHLELAVEVEADRMRGARVRDEDLSSERTVVLNELDRGENEALRKLLHTVYATAFQAHPYGHPVIGWRSDVETVTAAGLRHFYDTYYWPQNAVASVVGQFDRAEALDLLDRHFGDIPAGPNESDAAPEPLVHRAADEAVTREPEQRGERRVIVRQAGELGAVILAYKAPAGLDADADALDVLVQALSAGKSSRLYRRLTDRSLTTASSAFFPRLRDPGLFAVYGTLAPDVTHEAVEAEIRAVLHEVAADGLTVEEIERGRRQVVADEAFGRDGPYAVVSQLNEAIAVGDWTLFSEFQGRIEAVTAEAVQAAAARLVDDDRLTVGWYVPDAPGAGGDPA